MDLRGVEHGLREHRGHLGDAVRSRHGLPRGHPSQCVVGHGAMQILPRRPLQGDARQAVHVIVGEGLLKVPHVVLILLPKSTLQSTRCSDLKNDSTSATNLSLLKSVTFFGGFVFCSVFNTSSATILRNSSPSAASTCS